MARAGRDFRQWTWRAQQPPPAAREAVRVRQPVNEQDNTTAAPVAQALPSAPGVEGSHHQGAPVRPCGGLATGGWPFIARESMEMSEPIMTSTSRARPVLRSHQPSVSWPQGRLPQRSTAPVRARPTWLQTTGSARPLISAAAPPALPPLHPAAATHTPGRQRGGTNVSCPCEASSPHLVPHAGAASTACRHGWRRRLPSAPSATVLSSSKHWRRVVAKPRPLLRGFGLAAASRPKRG